jgi:hypothetical protein
MLRMVVVVIMMMKMVMSMHMIVVMMVPAHKYTSLCRKLQNSDMQLSSETF